jgi:hypothetical protein
MVFEYFFFYIPHPEAKLHNLVATQRRMWNLSGAGRAKKSTVGISFHRFSTALR